MHPQSTALFESVISKPRLNSYKGYFRASTDESVGLYMWNCELTANMGTLLALFEVILRNRIHHVLSKFYSNGASNSFHWYDVMPHDPYLVGKVNEIRTKMHPTLPSADEIVSRVSFGFWRAVLTYIPGNRGILEKIFPHHALSLVPAAPGTTNWTTKKPRRRALSFMHEINEFRNRVAHHEPVWKFPPVDDKLVNPWVRLFPGSTTEAESLTRLHRILGFIDNTVAAIEPALQADMAAASWRRKLNFLLTPRGIDRYRTLKHAPNTIVLPEDLPASFVPLVQGNQPFFVRQATAGGIFIPD